MAAPPKVTIDDLSGKFVMVRRLDLEPIIFIYRVSPAHRLPSVSMRSFLLPLRAINLPINLPINQQTALQYLTFSTPTRLLSPFQHDGQN